MIKCGPTTLVVHEDRVAVNSNAYRYVTSRDSILRDRSVVFVNGVSHDRLGCDGCQQCSLQELRRRDSVLGESLRLERKNMVVRVLIRRKS